MQGEFLLSNKFTFSFPFLPSLHLLFQAAADDSTTREVADPSTGDIDVPLDEFTFDPHVGVSEGGEETEI